MDSINGYVVNAASHCTQSTSVCNVDISSIWKHLGIRCLSGYFGITHRKLRESRGLNVVGVVVRRCAPRFKPILRFSRPSTKEPQGGVPKRWQIHRCWTSDRSREFDTGHFRAPAFHGISTQIKWNATPLDLQMWALRVYMNVTAVPEKDENVFSV